MLRFKIPQSRLDELLLRANSRTGPTALCAMGVNQRAELDLTEFLYHSTLGYGTRFNLPRLRRGLHPVLVCTAEGAGERERRAFSEGMRRAPVQAGLFLVTHQGTLNAFYALPGSAAASEVACLSVPGPRMEQLGLLPLGKELSSWRGVSLHQNAGHADLQLARTQWRRKYGRLAGAIGNGNVDEGYRLLARARGVRVSVIGAGRMGSWLAFRLAQSGVGAEAGLIIADPDIVEEPNLDGMLLPSQALGFQKAQAVASTIAAMVSHARPVPIGASLNSQEVVDAVRTSDVVFTAVDEEAARAATALLATRYHLLHVDVCGGTAWADRRRALVGGELRISIPGSPGCLACMGNYDWRRVEQLLELTPAAEKTRRAQTNWHEQRPGSSVDVLYPVIGEALQSFWNILKGQLRESTWLHYEKDAAGRPRWEEWSSPQEWGRCPVCSRQSGLGDLID